MDDGQEPIEADRWQSQHGRDAKQRICCSREDAHDPAEDPLVSDCGCDDERKAENALENISDRQVHHKSARGVS